MAFILLDTVDDHSALEPTSILVKIIGRRNSINMVTRRIMTTWNSEGKFEIRKVNINSFIIGFWNVALYERFAQKWQD